jgi:hypothetical protein
VLVARRKQSLLEAELCVFNRMAEIRLRCSLEPISSRCLRPVRRLWGRLRVQLPEILMTMSRKYNDAASHVRRTSGQPRNQRSEEAEGKRWK